MKIIYNKIIPFKGFKAINLFGILFTKKSLTEYEINHESIHTEQMKELLYIGFYIIYFFEWIYKYLFTKYRFTHNAYRNVSFEKEAYNNEKDLNYIEQRRKHYAMWRK